MRLWTSQYRDCVTTLERGETWHAPRTHDWRGWQLAYDWMCRQLAARGLAVRAMPVWAWHSVRAPGGKPDRAWTRDLIGSIPPGGEVALLELDAPDDCVVLSDYGLWNAVLDDFLDAGGNRGSPRAELRAATHADRLAERVFDPRLDREWHADENDAVQACLPWLEPGWVRRVEPLT